MAFNRTHIWRRAIPLLCLLMVMARDASAEMYKWVDEKGVTQYGDRLPPEYSQKANTKLNKRGVETKKTERAMTPAEIKARDDEAERLKQEEIKAKEQKRLDEIMLATYANESEIDLVRDRSLGPFDGKTLAARERIKYLRPLLADLTKQMAPYQSAAGPKKTAPPRLAKEFDAKKKEISDLERSIKNLETDKAGVVTKYSQAKQRFREIAAAGGAGKRLDSAAAKANLPTWVDVNSEVARSCLKNWQETLGDGVYGVFAEIKQAGQSADLILETRVRKKTGEFANVKATCPMRADGSFDQEAIRAKRAQFAKANAG